MNAFEFQNPTRLVFGEGQTARLAALVPQEARVLVLYGGGSAERNGTLDQIRTALSDRALHFFGGIEANPVYETLLNAVAVIRAERIDFLLAVGGGSVIDGSKFIAAAACFDGDPWDILLERGASIREALPLGAVLTLAATGSETNSGGVISRPSVGAKLPFRSPLLFPRFAILDPTRGYTLPERQIANGVVDAFVHVAEQYLTYPVDARVQDRFAEGLMQTLIEIGPEVLKNPQDKDLQSNLWLAANLALNGLIGSGVPQDWSTHMLGHELTALYGIDHARTLAAILPWMLEERRKTKHAKLLQYAERVWGITEGDDARRIDTALARTRAFFESMGLPVSIRAYGLDAGSIDTLVAHLEAHGMTALGEHRQVTPAVCRRVLERSLA